MLFSVVSFHKAVMSFTSGVRFAESLPNWRHILLSVAFLAVACPVGVAVGLAVTETGEATTLARGVLQGLATGTFIYVTFFEVLYGHLSTHGGRPDDGRRLLKIVAVLGGFGCISVLEMVAINITSW